MGGRKRSSARGIVQHLHILSIVAFLRGIPLRTLQWAPFFFFLTCRYVHIDGALGRLAQENPFDLGLARFDLCHDILG